MASSMHDAMLRCVYAALASANAGLERLVVSRGWEMREQNIPEINEQRRQGAGFSWVAVSFSSMVMFDLHAGIVQVDDTVSVGLHVHERIYNAEMSTILSTEVSGLPIQYEHNDLVREHQYNFPGRQSRDMNWQLAVGQAKEAIDLLSNVAVHLSA